MKLNSTKCTFSVRLEKLLGFIASVKGIEANVDKVKAIHESPSPCLQKKGVKFPKEVELHCQIHIPIDRQVRYDILAFAKAKP